MFKRFCLLLVMVFVLTACGSAYKTINQNKAVALINDGAILVDVRTLQEFEEGHIDGAINIPLDVIETISIDKESTVIVYCATGVRSAEAAKKLSELGYKNLYNLDGGLLNWG